MNIFYLFLVAGVLILYAIIQYDRQNKKKVEAILRANKNVPPLFMLRSAELKVNAIKVALSTQNESEGQSETKRAIAMQLEQLVASYTNRQIALAAYYAKLGSLLITVNELRSVQTGVSVEA
ncbi:MAG: hypothetical protein ABI203_09315 [Mucilaginibacter sp.]